MPTAPTEYPGARQTAHAQYTGTPFLCAVPSDEGFGAAIFLSNTP